MLDLLNHDCLEPVGEMWGMKKTDAKHYGSATYYGPEEDEDFSATDLMLELFVDGKILFFVKPWPAIRVRFTTARGVHRVN